MKKRLLAMVLTVAMCLSLLPVSALATDGDPQGPTGSLNAEGLEVDKYATPNDDGSFNLTMEAYTTGQVSTNTISKPTDIVLVLDMSGSMKDNYDTTTENYTAVYGQSYHYGKNNPQTGYGFNDQSIYYILVNGTYQKVEMQLRDKYGYERYFYTTGNGGSTQYHYFYPKLDTNLTDLPNREYKNDEVVQFYKRETVQKLTSLQNAVNSFIDQVATQNAGVETEKQHKISIVKFAGNINTDSGNGTYTTTSGKNTFTWNYSQIVSELTAVTTSNASTLKTTVTSLEPNGATRVDNGMNRACAALNYSIDIIDNDGKISGNAPEGRNQVVVVFTDGVPTTQENFESTVANRALSYSKQLKDKDVDVYSICISTDANVGTSLPNGDTDINRFMHLLSSNYPSAMTMKNGPTDGGSVDKGYYMVPGDMSLDGIFEKISENIAQPAISLGSSAVLKDTVTKYFDIVDNSITVQEVPCTGVDKETGAYTWGTASSSTLQATKQSNTDGTTTVSVTGFNYDANFVSAEARTFGDNTDFHGKKLVVTVKVKPKTGFWGGNNVPTNTSDSGIYTDEDTLIENFPEPKVNVPLKVPALEAQDLNIYCGNTAPNVMNLVTNASVFTKATGDDAWKTEFVSFSQITATSVSNTEDTDCTFSVTVSPTDADADSTSVGISATATTKIATGHVYVYVPTITFQDTTIEKGSTADYANNFVDDNTVWKHSTTDSTTVSTDVTMQGAMPTLDLTYDPDASAFESDTDVSVTAVKNNSTNIDITDYTTFAWQTNSASTGCGTGDGACAAAPTGNHFRVHVKDPAPTTGNLTVTKSFVGDDENNTIKNSFDGTNTKIIFTISKGTDTVKTVTLPTTDSTGNKVWTATVSGLTPGEYTVTESDASVDGYSYTTTYKVGQNTTQNVTIAANSTAGMDVTNSYTASPVDPPTPDSATLTGSTDLKISKTFSGRDWKDSDEFTFTLTGSEGAPMPADATNNMSTITIGKPESGNTNTGHFDNIRYDEAGTYTYTVREVPPEGVDSNNKLNGVTYSNTVYTVTVEVAKHATENKLVANATYASSTDNSFSYNTANAMTFTNSYSAAPVVVPGGDTEQEGSSEKIPGALKVSKNYNNWKDGDEFTFILTAKDKAPLPGNYETPGNADVTTGGEFTVNTSVSIKATKDHQTVAFDDITFSKAGTYTYTVSEVEGSISGVTYDKTMYTVVITVTDTGAGELGYKVRYSEDYDYTDAGAMTFTNTWKSTGGGGGGSHKPTLNTKDHYGYIIGYPVDYETGEKTTDQTRMPVKPQGNITRAEVATIFFRMLTDNSRNEFWSTTNAYSDVNDGQWFNNAISTLANAGILSGYPDGTFRPNAPITRAEFTKIAASFFEKVEYTMNNPFNDVDEDDWFYAFVMAAYEGGLITGYPEGDFRPTANITRAEAVTIVNRTLDRHPDQDYFLKDMLVWPDNMDTSKWYYADMQEATNSHEYVMKGSGDSKYENWTKMLEIRDWAAFEKEWSDANSAAGGEVSK